MTDFILVPDLGHGPFTWERVIGVMEDRLFARYRGPLHAGGMGRIRAIELPGHGAKDLEAGVGRVTLGDCVNRVVEVINQRSAVDYVLVGHGGAGAFLSQAVAEAPRKPKGLVLIGGVVPAQGRSILQAFPFPWRLAVGFMSLSPKVRKRGLRLHKEIARRILCNDMEYPDAAWVIARLRALPLKALKAPVDHRGFSGLGPITFVKLALDRVFPLLIQERSIEELPRPEIVEIKSGHEAPLSQPEQIAQILLGYA